MSSHLINGVILSIISIYACEAQTIHAVTQDGKSVILNFDGTWRYSTPDTTRSMAMVYKSKPGGFGGSEFGLQMAGWSWDELPKQPKLSETNVRGKIVFEIEINEDGEVTSIKTLENQLSPTTERLVRQEITGHSFVKTSTGKTPNRTRGQITFNLDIK